MSCTSITAVLTDDLALKIACENGNLFQVKEILQRESVNINAEYSVRSMTHVN